MRNTKHFHVLSRSKTVKTLTEKEYLKRLGKGSWLIGWIDNTDVLFSKGDNVVYLRRKQLEAILELGVKPE